MNEKLQQLKQLCDEENRELFTDEVRKEIDKILSNYDLDFCTPNYEDYEREDDEWFHSDPVWFCEKLTYDLYDWVREQEIIYYSRAVEYLSDNDPSFNRAMELASEFWYETKDLNSELLATLVYQDDLQHNIPDCMREIEDLLY